MFPSIPRRPFAKTSSSKTTSACSRLGHRARCRLSNSPFSRYSTVTFNPDHVGDLIYNGAASRVFRSDWGNGFQVDTAYHGFDQHTFRFGGYFDAERAEIDNHEAVFQAILDGSALRLRPISIVDDIALQTWTYSVYVQDEWKPIRELTFNIGVRFDLYDGLVRADQASPRVGPEYKPSKARRFMPATRGS